MDTESIEMSQRVSRKRRHLPTSITSATSTRSLTGRRHVPLLKMSYRKQDSGSEDEIESEASSTARSGKKEVYQRRSRHQAKLKQKARRLVTSDTQNKNTRRHVVWLISAVWILFLVYRIFISMQKENYTNISLVHFIANKIKSIASTA